MRAFALPLILGTAILSSGCSLDYIAPELLPDPARPSDAPRVASYISPTDHTVVFENSDRVEYAPLIAPQ